MFHVENLSVMVRAAAGVRFFCGFGAPALVVRRLLLLRPGSVTAMAPMPEHVHQEAPEKQKEGQVLKDMRLVLGDEKKCGDEDESPEYPAQTPVARSVRSVGVIG